MAKKKTKKIIKSKKINTSNRSKKVTASPMPIQPLGDRVLIQELGEEDLERTTASGIIIPDSLDKDSGGKRGRVVAVGLGRIDDGQRVPVPVTPGQTVLYQWGDKITIKGEEYVIVQESQIIAILN